jgi:hypothetical protein
MRKNIIINSTAVVLAIVAQIFLLGNTVRAQEKEKSPLVVSVAYFAVDNSQQYLTVAAKSKIDGKFQPIGGVEVKLYLANDAMSSGTGLIGKVVTNEKGRAKAMIPASVAAIWKTTPNHTFVAVTDKTPKFDETKTELSVAQGKITIDTADDKNVTATVSQFKDGAWVPMKGVDVKLGIKRLCGDLQIGDEQSYTTDSLGRVKGELKKMKMPGGKTGNIMLVAKVEDNDVIGNLRIEKDVPWGVQVKLENTSYVRALWASQFHSPLWLVAMAYSIVLAVWGTIVYLIFLLIRLKKLGMQEKTVN